MKTNFEIAQEINATANEYYNDMSMSVAFAWGCAQSLLTAEQLELILTIAKSKVGDTQ
jgi:hypothetical protein